MIHTSSQYVVNFYMYLVIILGYYEEDIDRRFILDNCTRFRIHILASKSATFYLVQNTSTIKCRTENREGETQLCSYLTVPWSKSRRFPPELSEQ